MAQRKTAILLFSFSEQKEQQRKTFFDKTDLHQLLVKRVKRTIALTGIDYFHFSDNEQVEGDFGTKFSDTIEKVYAKGYDAVITIGNDSPNLKASHILKAQEALEKNEFVLGPSYDGGFYLMGLQKEFFKKSVFENFSWKTSEVASEIKNYIKEHFTAQISLLQYLRDLDSHSDLEALLKTLSPSLSAISTVIQFILFKVKKWQYTYLNSSYSFFIEEFNYNKGSPLTSL